MMRSSTARLVALLCLAAGVGCAPNPKAPVSVMAIVPSAAGNVETRQVTLTTVTDVSALKGSLLTMVGGNRVVVDPNDPLQASGIENMSDDQRYDVLVRNKGMDVRGDFVDRSGVLWPAEFHTWNMVTTYYNFEQAFLYWNNVYNGADTTEIQGVRVMYWPDVMMNSVQLTDNALFLSFIESFVIVPPQSFQLVPLAMNLGVIGHEYAHKVFNVRALDGKGINPALTTWSVPTAFNLLKSIDEGFADYHGWAVTCTDAAGCRPNFLQPSVSDSNLVHARDMSRADACMTGNLRSSYNNYTASQWVSATDMYQLGTVWAAALYQAGNKMNQNQVVQRALLASYSDQSAATPGIAQLIDSNLATPGNFTMEAVADIIVSHVSDKNLQKYLCNEFSDRLQLSCNAFPCTDMPHCPATSSRGTTSCPTLP